MWPNLVSSRPSPQVLAPLLLFCRSCNAAVSYPQGPTAPMGGACLSFLVWNAGCVACTATISDGHAPRVPVDNCLGHARQQRIQTCPTLEKHAPVLQGSPIDVLPPHCTRYSVLEAVQVQKPQHVWSPVNPAVHLSSLASIAQQERFFQP